MDQEDQPITFLAIDASSGNSICIEHLGGVESLREWSVLVKNTLYKTVGKSKSEWKELAVFTDIEATLYNRSLTYKEDIQVPVLTLNSLVLGQEPVIHNEDPTDTENKDLRKRQKYIQGCKEATWKRWRNCIVTQEAQFKTQQERTKG